MGNRDRKKPRIGAVMVVQNDAETIEKSLASFYNEVECIVVSTDPHRGWSGKKIVADDTIARIKGMDTDRKVVLLEDDFCHFDDPMRNDTYQRQVSADALHRHAPNLDWVVQVDADEQFLDFAGVLKTLERLPSLTRSVSWRWISLFNILEDGRYLVVVDAKSGRPELERFPLAHRPGAKLKRARIPHLPIRALRRYIPWEFDPGPQMAYNQAVLHYSFAKSEKRIEEKLQTWSHSHEIDVAQFFALWKRSRTDWASLRDFHPTHPVTWPALKPYTLAELQAEIASPSDTFSHAVVSEEKGASSSARRI